MSVNGNWILRSWLLLSLLVLGLDRWTKWLASSELYYGEPVPVTFFFDLRLLHNTGAAFSMLASQDGWQRWLLALIAVGISIFIVVWIWRLQGRQHWLACALALVLGGALGNLWDRISLGYVVDFISVHWQQWYFPAFNIADSAITVGAVMLALDMFRRHDEPDQETADE